MSKSVFTHRDLEVVTRMLAKEYGIRVVCEGTTARNDGKGTIYLPALDEDSSPKILSKCRYFLDHEAGHTVGKSDVALLTKFIDERGGVAGSILNAVEDRRIEDIMARIWLGCGINMKEGIEWVTQYMEEEAAKDSERAAVIKHPLKQMISSIYLHSRRMPTRRPNYVTDAVWDVVGKYADELKQAEAASSTQGCVAVAEKLLDEYEKMMGRQQPQPQPQDQSGGEEGLPNPVESGGGKGKGKGKGKGSNGGDSDADGDDVGDPAPADGNGESEEKDEPTEQDGEAGDAEKGDTEEEVGDGDVETADEDGDQEAPEDAGGQGAGPDPDDDGSERPGQGESDGSSEGDGMGGDDAEDDSEGAEGDAHSAPDAGGTGGDAQGPPGGGAGRGAPRELTATEKEAIASNPITESIQQDATAAPTTLHVRAWSNDIDKYYDAAPSTNQSAINEARTSIRERARSSAEQRLVQLLASEDKVGWSSGRRSGQVDKRQLHKLVTRTSDRVLRKSVITRAPDTACCLLVDSSGSMAGMKIRVAQDAAISFGRVLDRAGHAAEIGMFFDTNGASSLGRDGLLRGMSYGDGRAMEKVAITRATSNPPAGLRYDGAMIVVAKRYDETMEASAAKLATLSGRAGGGTPLAEAIAFAGKRLAARSESRKVLLAFTDGEPCLYYGEFEIEKDAATQEIERGALKAEVEAEIERGREELAARLKRFTEQEHESLLKNARRRKINRRNENTIMGEWERARQRERERQATYEKHHNSRLLAPRMRVTPEVMVATECAKLERVGVEVVIIGIYGMNPEKLHTRVCRSQGALTDDLMKQLALALGKKG